VQARIEKLLHEQGVTLDAVYYCPHHPTVSECDCRKPALGMYREAVRNLGVDLARSVYIGDKLKDPLPALTTGGRGFLVRTGYGAEEEKDAPSDVEVVADLLTAARRTVEISVICGRFQTTFKEEPTCRLRYTNGRSRGKKS
jgi:D-glycero-D-manno-heptose 1,7-bisphosphate phosphatase